MYDYGCVRSLVGLIFKFAFTCVQGEWQAAVFEVGFVAIHHPIFALVIVSRYDMLEFEPLLEYCSFCVVRSSGC